MITYRFIVDVRGLQEFYASDDLKSDFSIANVQ